MNLTMMANKAKAASYALMTMSTGNKNAALYAMADALQNESGAILASNIKDVAAAEQRGISRALIDRLRLDSVRIAAMAQSMRDVAALPDPIGGADEMVKRPNGLLIAKRRVPLGVIGIIYEARPNVTADAIALCIKSGNAVLLRGGTEAINSNAKVASICANAAEQAGLPVGAIGFIDDVTHEAVLNMMRLNGLIDVLIPRGGAKLIATVVENATVPVIETGTGNCHIYVDLDADLQKASRILFNAKCSRPSVCNAAEKLLVSRAVAGEFFALISEQLKAKGVEVRGCSETCALLPWAIPATDEDWFTEYLDLKLGVKVVSGLDEAISHINTYGTRHSEAIVTENYTTAQRFLDEIDAAAVYVNASTRFTDGGEFGFGAELGISTQKLHARGPMGLREMTTYKYCIYGDGQIR